MALKYINTSLSGNGGDGTDTNPFTKDQFCSAINGSSDTFKVKGTGTITSISAMVGNASSLPTLEKWETAAWRLRVLGNFGATPAFKNFNISGGIIYMECAIPSGAPTNYLSFENCSVSNCDIRSKDIIRADATGSFKGCLFTFKYSGFGSSSIINMYDSTFRVVAGSFASSANVTFNNCVTTSANFSSSVVNNCQSSWAAPALPAWDAAETEWDYPTISAGITTPPQPGNAPYTGYSEFLFGGSRTGIGTGFVIPVVAPTITTQPISQKVSKNFTATFSVGVAGDAPITYQWKKNGADITGEVSSTLQISNAKESDQAFYTVVVTNPGGSVTSSEIFLEIIKEKKDGASKSPDDRVGMPKANAETSGTPIRDSNLATSERGNTLEKNRYQKGGLRDDKFGSSDGVRANNNEIKNEVKQLIAKIQELAQPIVSFFYKIR